MNDNNNIKFSKEKFQEILGNNPDELFYLINSLLDKVQETTEMVTKLSNRVKELESQINKDSHNSNKAPSTDGLKKKPSTKSLRKKSNKKSGGQTGHIGKTLKINPNPDIETPLKVCNCSKCGKSLIDAIIKGIERRQVIDIIITKYTEEYQAEIKDCPDCQTTNMAIFPENVVRNVQ